MSTRALRAGHPYGIPAGYGGAAAQRHLHGTTQRFLYCSTVADDIPDQMPESPPLGGSHALWTYPGICMQMAQPIKEEIWRDHLAHMRGEVDEDRLDARKNLTKVKLAGLLTLLNDRTRQIVGEEEWDLAEVMWQTSCNVRDHYRALADSADRKQRDASDTAYAKREGKAEAARAEARDGYVPRAVVRCAKLIAKHMHAGKVATVNDARQCLAGRDKQWLEDALEYAASVLWIRIDGDQVVPGESMPV